MNKKLTSIIWTITKDSLQKILDTSNSIYEILPKLGLSKNSAGSFVALKKRIYSGEFNLVIFENNRKLNPCYRKIKLLSKSNTIPLDSILKENSKYCRHNLKLRLVKEGLLEYKCNKCNNTGEWMGEKINLQIDHINGINDDNRLENLRFMCPNCHSQTHNFCGRNTLKKENHCKQCNLIIHKESTICMKCRTENNLNRRKVKITKEEMQELVLTNTWKNIATKFNVSETTIRKTAIKLGVNISHKFKNRCPSKIIKLDKDAFIKELKENSVTYLRKKYKCDKRTINKLIKNYGIEYKNKCPSLLSEEESKIIIDLYNSGKSITYIHRETKRTRKVIRDLLKKQNIYRLEAKRVMPVSLKHDIVSAILT